ncbi:hypothetical protein [Micromonospora mirobrigensis]|uniref:hypothetical protein n=1 Tax=Micromonospora mirobrigensis TaxID=262898 RepID=UPI001FDEC6C9|nr:hypothetical protein [Micromonospora mirobrigensis]
MLSRLPGAHVTFVAERPGPVVNAVGSLRLYADAALADAPSPDVIVVPGGPGQNAHLLDGPVQRWLRIGGDVTAQATQLAHEYQPRPPYQAGDPATAPREIVRAVLARRDTIVA